MGNHLTRKLIPIYLVIFVSFFYYSSMLTMFVPLLQGHNGPFYKIVGDGGFGNALSGLFLALYPLGQFIGSPIIGSVSDNYGRKKVIVASLFITTICLLLMAYSVYIASLWVLGLSCFLAGLGESNMAVALSFIADITNDENRASIFAKAWAMCSVGYITGSLFGGAPVIIGYVSPFVIEAIMSILTVGITLYYMDNIKSGAITKISFLKSIQTFSSVFKPSHLRIHYLTNFVVYFAFFGVLRTELLYMHGIFLLNQSWIAFFYAYASCISMLGNFIITPILLKYLNVRKVVLLSGIIAITASILFVSFSKASSLYLTTALIGLSIPIFVAMIGASISSFADTNEQGVVMGINQSLMVLAEAVSAIAGGLLFNVFAAFPFMIFAGIGLCGIGIYKFYCAK
jgi:MFS family permease